MTSYWTRNERFNAYSSLDPVDLFPQYRTHIELYLDGFDFKFLRGLSIKFYAIFLLDNNIWFLLLMADGGGQSAYINSPCRIRSLQTGGSTDGLFCMIRSVDIIIMTIYITRGRRRREILFFKKCIIFSPSRYYADIFQTVGKAPRENRQTLVAKVERRFFNVWRLFQIKFDSFLFIRSSQFLKKRLTSLSIRRWLLRVISGCGVVRWNGERWRQIRLFTRDWV